MVQRCFFVVVDVIIKPLLLCYCRHFIVIAIIKRIINEIVSSLIEISGSHGGDYEGDCLPDCCNL
jgi:hypothetical protein